MRSRIRPALPVRPGLPVRLALPGRFALPRPLALPIRLALPVLVALLAVACVELLGDPEAIRSPRGIQFDVGEVELARGDTVEATAVVLDQQGVPFTALPEGTSLTWSSSDTSVVRIEATPGELTALLIAETSGATQVRVALGSLAVTGNVLVRAGVHRLEEEEGGSQSGTVGDPLPLPVAVRALTEDEAPVAGVMVTFHVTEGGGSVAPESAETDEEGIAEAEWTLGTGAGPQAVEARFRDLDPVVFQATALPGGPAALVVDPTEVALDALGDTVRIQAEAEDLYGNALPELPLTWSSSPSLVAEVDDEGLVTALARGEAVITVEADTLEVLVSVFVDPQVAVLEISPAEASFTALGDTLRFQAAAFDANQNELDDVAFAWSSLDPGLLSVDEGGLATALGTGTAGVQVQANGRADSASVSISQDPDALAILASPDPMNALGQIRSLEAEITDRNGFTIPGAPVTWTSLDEEVAVVGADGIVEGVGVGTTEVVATSGSLADTVEVQVRQVAASVTVSPDLLEMSVGDVSDLMAAAADSNGFAIPDPEVVWGSLDPSVASVDGEGTVTAQGEGETSILAVLDGVDGSAQVVVTLDIEIDFICLFPSQASFAVGDSLQFVARAVLMGDEGCSDVEGLVYTWESSDPSVVSVDQNGLARGEGPGDALITVSAAGRQRSSSVNVFLTEPLMLRTVGSGSQHACGVDGDGQAWCWGAGWSGQIGDGEFQSRALAVRVSGNHQFESIGGGDDWNCALTPDGEAWCWGSNWIGQLGQDRDAYWGTTVPEAVPTSYRFVQLDGGELHNCGAATTGESLCTGDNFWGGLGVGDYDDRYAFTPNAGGVSFQKVSAGWMHTCGITPGGAAYCWGDDRMGEAGNGETYDFPNVPVPVDTQLSFMDIATGGSFTCALTTGGEAWCWGANYYGMLGVENPPHECRPFSGASLWPCATTPVPVNTGLTFTRISAGQYHVCALTAGGDVYCWGRGVTGALGNGGYEDSSTPVLVSGGHPFVDLALGWYSACAVTSDDEVWCWGESWAGQLATGVFDEGSPVPVRAQATVGEEAMTLGDAVHAFGSAEPDPELAEWLQSRTTREDTPPFRRTPR